MNCVDPGQMASADLDLHLKRFIGICQSYLHNAFIRPNTVFVQLVQQRKGEKPDLVWICFNNYYSATGLQGKWNGKGAFRRHDSVVLTKSYMILSCMIFLFRRHYNVMCDFFQQWRKLAGHLELSHHALHRCIAISKNMCLKSFPRVTTFVICYFICLSS